MSEDALQIHCAKLLNSYARPDIEWHHVPNGGQRNKKTAQRLKAMGTQSGVADLQFVIDNRPIAVELKTEIGSQSKDQIAYQERFTRAGGTYFIARGLDQAIAVLTTIKTFRSNITIQSSPSEARG